MASPSHPCGLCNLSPGLCGCTCTNPPLPLCSSCMLQHIASPGSHVVQSLPSVSVLAQPVQTSMNEFCSQCMNEVPETVCCCDEAGIVLCRGCIASHNSKFQDKMHIILPLKARSYVSAPGYLERLTKRQSSLNEGMKELRNNLKKVNKCEKKLILRVEKAMKEICEYRETTIRRLTEYRANLELKVNETKAEIEGHIYEDTYVPGDSISRLIWDYTPGRLNLFNYTEIDVFKVEFNARLEPVQAPVAVKAKSTQLVPAAKTPTPIQPPLPASLPQQSPQAPKPQPKVLPTPPRSSSSKPSPRPSVSLEPLFSSPLFCLAPNLLMFFNAATGTFPRKVALTPTTAIVQTASASLLPDGRVLVCGKKKPLSAAAYLIDTGNGQVTKLQDMRFKRTSHGLITYGCFTFAFGGSGEPGILASSEQYSIRSKVWTEIKSMLTPRSLFNPCLWGDFIYILGGANTLNCEVYDICNNDFVPLSLRVPIVCQTSAALASDSTIIVIQKGRVARWRIGDERFEEELNSGPKDECWGNVSPIVVGNKAYIPMFGKMKVKQIVIPA